MERLTGVDRHPVALMLGIDAAAIATIGALRSRPSMVSLFVLMVIALPVVAAVLERPQRGVLAVAALAPFEGLLAIGPDIPHSANIIEALVVSTLLASLVAKRPPRRRESPPWAFAFVAVLALGLVSAFYVHSTAALFGLKTVYFYALLGAACWRCPLTRDDRDHLVSILMVTGTVTAAYGILQQFLGGVRLHDLGYEYNSTIRFAGGFLRSFSSFVQPFGFGLFQALVLAVCLPVALADRGRRRNRLFLLVMPLLVLGMVSSIVRAAWVAAAVGVTYVSSSRHRGLLLLVPLVVGVALLIPGQAVHAALSTTSTSQRTAGWRDNAHLVASHPLGIGIGSTGSAAITAAERGAHGGPSYQPDNWYVKVLLELGPIGLWLWLMFFGGAIGSTRRASKVLEGSDGAFAVGVTAAFLGAAAACVMATYFEIFPLDLLFWVLLMAVESSRDVPMPVEQPVATVAG